MAVFLNYLKIGFLHVLPLGYDHVLFILSLFFLDSRLRTAVIQCSIFTLAHSCTLALVALGYLHFDSGMIETMIALSIFFVAIENMLQAALKPWRIAQIFFFGLVHGMGFATALKEVGLPQNELIAGLLGFNLGVELAQVCLIVCCYLLLARWARSKSWYRNSVVQPLSMGIAGIALFWAITRFISG